MMERGVPVRRSCALVGISSSSLYYKRKRTEDPELLKELQRIARKFKRFGYRRAWAMLKRAGKKMNVKKVHRIWKKEGLALRKKPGRKRLKTGRSVPLKALYPNHVWTYDFMLDSTADGRAIRILTIVDEFTRECLAIHLERSMPAVVILEVLERLFRERGGPEYLRSDNGPEFVAKIVQAWLERKGTKTHYIAPASPWENAYGESFNDKVRGECLNMEVFYSLAEAKVVVESWRRHYNEERPHSSLDYRTPLEFRDGWQGAELKSSLSPAPGSLRSALARAGEREESLGVD
jgi:putative transposase